VSAAPSSDYAGALVAICGIGVIIAGAFAGVARSARDTIADQIAAARQRRAMRTASSRVIERQVRELQRRASDTRP
jgi:F0F1-type ATP synthase membrane subunit b/b'